MIPTVALFTLLILQLTQFLVWVFVLYFIGLLLAFPVRYFWGAITHKTHL